MNILLIDDDQAMIGKMEHDLEVYFLEYYEEVNFFSYSSNFSLIDYSIIYDYGFIDIDLLEENGIEVAQKLKRKQSRMNVIFVSSHSNLIHDSLWAQPMYFIRKSEYKKDLEKFFEMISSIEGENKVIDLLFKGELRRVLAKEIIYIEAYDHSLKIKTITQVYEDSRTLRDIYEVLPKECFARVSKSFIINFDYLLSNKKNTVNLVGGFSLNIGRSYKEEFEKRFMRYMLK